MLQSVLIFITQNVWAAFLIAFFFGGSIFVHELGHFLVARLTGIHVDRFSIGFGPAIWSWRGKDGVEYRLSWFPLGGYVLLPQLADLGPIEGKPTRDVSSLPPPSYAAKMLVFVAGAVFNVLFAFGLACIIFVVGTPEGRDLATTTIGYVSPTVDLANGKLVKSPALEAGLEAGDIIRSVDGTRVRDWNDVTTLVKLSSGRSPSGAPELRMGIERAGRPITVVIHPKLGGEESYRVVGISPFGEPIIDTVRDGSAAAQAGFQKGDEIKRVGDTLIQSNASFVAAVNDNAGKVIPVWVKRAGRDVILKLKALPGAGPNNPPVSTTGFLTLTSPTVFVHPSPFTQVWDEVDMTVRTVASLINPHSDVGLSKMTGIIGIVQVYHQVAPEGLIPVMGLTILINVNLAILNLLPVPVLDGGQMLFATIAWVRGRSLPMNFIVATQSVFMMAILVLMFYIGWFDILRLRHG